MPNFVNLNISETNAGVGCGTGTLFENLLDEDVPTELNGLISLVSWERFRSKVDAIMTEFQQHSNVFLRRTTIVGVLTLLVFALGGSVVPKEIIPGLFIPFILLQAGSFCHARVNINKAGVNVTKKLKSACRELFYRFDFISYKVRSEGFHIQLKYRVEITIGTDTEETPIPTDEEASPRGAEVLPEVLPVNVEVVAEDAVESLPARLSLEDTPIQAEARILDGSVSSASNHDSIIATPIYAIGRDIEITAGNRKKKKRRKKRPR